MTKFRFAMILASTAAMQFASLSQPASAADLPSLKDTPYVAVPFSWQGPYIGGHAGGVWGNAGVTDEYYYMGDPTASNSFAPSGFIAGGQAGYNFQRGHIVYGVEADIGYLGLSGSKSAVLAPSPECTLKYGAGSQMCKLSADYSTSGGLYGDLTGRLGYAADRTLFYAKGGAAFLNTDIKASYVGQNYTGNAHTFNFGQSDTLWGWTVGAGVEYALNPSWSLKAEYQHFDFGSDNIGHNDTFVLPCGGCKSTLKGSADVSLTSDAVSLGVNYHLNKTGDEQK